ncbi:SixA phosphatase family protein [Methylobacterium planeticum]|uniref:Histidine phosphatase family protein n=1 Tax=Methylobacterium planeticum TaxID=2615211 RepID=A0A6N6MXE8_9HYPH|nr:histidine phosphatase family protein [Methylobacterium planeticum]KAB1074690.1 histidine phosphatase family protein [Methylobacterium planeticum]
MRRLILLRHAKSDRPAGVADLERPLNPRGREAAPRMGAYLAAEGLVPDHVVVSPARRTRETWDLVEGALGAIPHASVDAVYEAPASALHRVLRETPAEARSLLLVGHNPGLQDLALKLVRSGPREAMARLRTGFPTAALAVIDFEAAAWSEIGWGEGRLERFVTPKDLGDRDSGGQDSGGQDSGGDDAT